MNSGTLKFGFRAFTDLAAIPATYAKTFFFLKSTLCKLNAVLWLEFYVCTSGRLF